MHDNVPLPRPESVDDTLSVTIVNVGDTEDERPLARGRDTMNELIGQKVSSKDEECDNDADDEQRAELQLHGTEEQISTLQDLSELLYTRGRLQELGCTFTDLGELITYGDPPNLKECEQLLRLGPVYDEQWASFFRHPEDPFPNNEPNMWSDMRTLKRVLANEGVAFGPQHRRLTWGNGSEKVVRLCAAYDDLQKLWWAAQPPLRILDPVDEREEEDLNDANDDSGCFMDEEFDRMDQNSKDLGVPPLDVERSLHRRSGVPQNIGWRFSDDIDLAAAARLRDSLSIDEWAEMEEDLEVAVTVPLPTEDEPAPSSPPLQLEELRPPAPPPTTTGTFLNPYLPRHGPSPLQVSCGFSHKPSSDQLIEEQTVTTPSMLHREELTANPRANDMDSLGLDRRIIAAMEAAPSMKDASEAQKVKKKGLRGWWRGVVGRKTGAVPYQQVELGAAWW